MTGQRANQQGPVSGRRHVLFVLDSEADDATANVQLFRYHRLAENQVSERLLVKPF